MARRGEELRDHILWTAKDVFLELGFERASMDLVAARAATSKRSLYAHFESKDRLFLAVVELVRELYLTRLGSPADHDGDPAEAVARFCAHFRQVLLSGNSVRTCRLVAGEAGRVPQAAARHYDTAFAVPERRLAQFIADRYALADERAAELAGRAIGKLVLPHFLAALYSAEATTIELSDEPEVVPEEELGAIRRAIDELLAPLRASLA